MRFGSQLGILIFGIGLLAGVYVLLQWVSLLRRLAADYERLGRHAKADLLRMQLRSAIFRGGGSLVFIVIFWLAILHDLRSCS